MLMIDVIDAARAILNEPLSTARSFPDNTSGFWTDATLLSYFNLVQRDIMNDIIGVDEEYFVTQSALSIVNGTDNYAFPSGAIKIRRIEDIRQANNPVEVYPVDLNSRERAIDSLYQLPSGTNYVGGYYIRGNRIVLTDTPTFTNASAIMVYYIREIPELTTTQATGVSEIPAEFHNLLVWGIVKYSQYQQGVADSFAAQEYERLNARMKNQAEDRQVQRSRRVKTFFYRGQ